MKWSELSGRNKGILFVLMNSFCFAVMSFCVKAAGDLPVMEKVFFRNAVAAVFSAVLLARSKDGFRIRKGSLPFLFIRSVSGGLGMICNFYAIDHLDIADANILNKLSPFFAIIFSIFVLKETASRIDWLLVAIAFCGALLVIKPSFSPQVIPALLGTLGGLGAGLAYTFVRLLGKRGERGIVIVFFFSVFTSALTLPFFIAGYVPMSPRQLLLLLGAGFAATGGQMTVTAAYQHAPAKDISVFDYSQVIFAALIGFLFLGEIPDRYSVLGYIIIISAAFARWHTGRKADNAAAKALQKN